MKRLRLDAAARAELLHEVAYYEATRPGTGRRFREAVVLAFDRVRRTPRRQGTGLRASANKVTPSPRVVASNVRMPDPQRASSDLSRPTCGSPTVQDRGRASWRCRAQRIEPQVQATAAWTAPVLNALGVERLRKLFEVAVQQHRRRRPSSADRGVRSRRRRCARPSAARANRPDRPPAGGPAQCV